jgi:hypothetical protein
VDDLGARILELIELLGLTREKVALGSGGKLKRQDVSRIVSGQRPYSTERHRLGFSAGFGLEPVDLDDFVAGRIDPAGAAAKAHPPKLLPVVAAGVTKEPVRVERDASDTPLVRMVARLGYRIDGQFSAAVIRAAQATAAVAAHRAKPNTDIEALAQSFLDAAKDAEADGEPLDERTIGAAAAVLRSTTPARVIAEQSAVDNLEAAAEEAALRGETPKAKR